MFYFAAEYTQIGGDEALPLGEEFQELIRCFVQPGEKKIHKQYQTAAKIIQQLGWVHLMLRSYNSLGESICC